MIYKLPLQKIREAEAAGWINLDLSTNQLMALPAEIYQLTNLTNLDLSGNLLTTLPAEIGQLTHLFNLNLSGNLLTTLPPEIGQLTQLECLYLNRNRLTTLPPEIGQLTQLSQLNLSSNSLTALPPEIGQLTRLTALDLSSNRLTTLPPEIIQLSQLRELDLRNNLLPIPPEILANYKDPDTIILYYLDSLSQKSRPLNEAKMVLVGQGAVGKTSLVNRLAHNTFDAQENKTEGIAITPWEIENPAISAAARPTTHNPEPTTPFRINIWDFGGQEIMHATHQFFLTKRTLYLLVLDARQAEADNRLDYWLQIIASFGGDSPIIIVGNKTDQQRLDIDRAGIRLRYPNVKAIVETSCATGDGIAELQSAIAQTTAQLPHVFDELLATWFDVKAQLEKMDADYITFEQYTALCQQANVANPDSQRTLLGFLHDLGVVLCFQDDPRLAATHILNPEWVTQGVYAILNHQPLLQHGGILARAMLSDILDPQRYPWLKHLFIIDMMRKFELCFDLEGEKDERFLIPDLLPKTAPATGADTGDWQDSLGFRYQYTVLPGSILTRLIVRLHPYIDPARTWRTGAVLTYSENHALVRADMHQQRIHIRVNGPARGRRTLLGIIRSHFDYIHRTIPNLQVTEQVPLPEHPDIVVDYKHLLTLEKLGQTVFIPYGLEEAVNVRELLDGVRYQPLSSVGLSPSLAPLLRSTLLSCTALTGDTQLHALFTDARLHPWRNTIPETAASRDARVDTLIDYLYDKQNRRGENALVLLLHVLADHTDPADALHSQLIQLAVDFDHALAEAPAA